MTEVTWCTYTTLSYGDITLSPGWRLPSGIEAMDGILLFGWTTALLSTVAQRTWKASHVGKPSGEGAVEPNGGEP